MFKGKDLLLPLFRSDYLFEVPLPDKFPRIEVEWCEEDRKRLQEGCPEWIKEAREKMALREVQPDGSFKGVWHQMRDSDRFLESLSKLDSLEGLFLLKARRGGYVGFRMMLEQCIK